MSGVLSSWLTLATKSRRTPSRRRSSVRSTSPTMAPGASASAGPGGSGRGSGRPTSRTRLSSSGISAVKLGWPGFNRSTMARTWTLRTKDRIGSPRHFSGNPRMTRAAGFAWMMRPSSPSSRMPSETLFTSRASSSRSRSSAISRPSNVSAIRSTALARARSSATAGRRVGRSVRRALDVAWSRTRASAFAAFAPRSEATITVRTSEIAENAMNAVVNSSSRRSRPATVTNGASRVCRN